MPNEKNTGENESTAVATIKLPELTKAVGIRLPEDLSYEQWAEELHKLKQMQKHWHAYLGDAIRFGRRKFGDKVTEATLTQLEFNFAEVKKSELIASVPIERREEFSRLNPEHFYVVGKKVEGEKEQEEWLQSAVKNNLNGRELEMSIETGDKEHPVRLNTNSETSGRGSGSIRTIHAAMHEIEMWMEAIGDDYKSWKAKEAKEFLDLTSDFANLREEVAMSLAK